MKRNSVTLIELLIVVIVIGILATFAVPTYRGIQQRIVDEEARNNLKLVQTAQLNKRIETGQFIACAANRSCNTELGLDLPLGAEDGGNWDYKVELDDNSFKAYAERGSGENLRHWKIRAEDNCAWGKAGKVKDRHKDRCVREEND